MKVEGATSCKRVVRKFEAEYIYSLLFFATGKQHVQQPHIYKYAIFNQILMTVCLIRVKMMEAALMKWIITRVHVKMDLKEGTAVSFHKSDFTLSFLRYLFWFIAFKGARTTL